MFTHLEGLLKRSFARNYPDEALPRTMAALTKNLSAKNVIDSDLRDRLDGLRKQRNTIAHNDPNIGKQVADDYFDSVSTALVELTKTSLFR